jgi:hypothetical protein
MAVEIEMASAAQKMRETPAEGTRESQGGGQGFVEFMLVVPIVLAMIFGIIEAARWFAAVNALQNAARETARYASTGQPYAADCDEFDSYQECRVETIQQVAMNLAGAGLVVDPAVTDETAPKYLGVEVWGAPCLDGADPDCDPELDNPGVAQGKVEIRMDYNHPITNPFFSTWFPAIHVSGRYQIVNEPWYGSAFVDPPAIPPAPTPEALDSDGDGWPDDDERDVYGTRPNSNDTDNDGYYDGDGSLTPTEPNAVAAKDACVPDQCAATCPTRDPVECD